MAAAGANVSLGQRAVGGAVVTGRASGVAVGGADVAADDAAIDSSAMLSSGTTGGTLLSFFCNCFLLFSSLHLPHWISF